MIPIRSSDQKLRLFRLIKVRKIVRCRLKYLSFLMISLFLSNKLFIKEFEKLSFKTQFKFFVAITNCAARHII